MMVQWCPVRYVLDLYSVMSTLCAELQCASRQTHTNTRTHTQANTHTHTEALVPKEHSAPSGNWEADILINNI